MHTFRISQSKWLEGMCIQQLIQIKINPALLAGFGSCCVIHKKHFFRNKSLYILKVAWYSDVNLNSSCVHNVSLCLLWCSFPFLSHYSTFRKRSQQIIRVYFIDFPTPWEIAHLYYHSLIYFPFTELLWQAGILI